MRRLWKISKTKWYTKPAYLLVALAIVLSLGIVAVPMAGTVEAQPPNEVWVDGAGPSCPDTGSGTQADPYCKIQDGIDAVAEGGTVTVAAGTYNETVEVNKELTLQGEGRDVVTVTAADDYVFNVTAHNVTISGFNITGAREHGIYLDTSSDNTISDNEITDNGDDGIHLDSSSGNTISDNEITANVGHGIYIDKSSDNTISDNEITANDGHGIYIDKSSDNTISDNEITANDGHGIHIDKSSDNTISDNEITANVGHGIHLDKSSGNTISDNEITANVGHGIYIDKSSDNTISDNEITANDDDGIHVDSDSSGNAIHFNNIVGNSSYGICNEAAEMVDAENNWWGDASGPTHASNPGGSGDTVSDNVDYDPWLGAELEEAQSEDVSGDGGTVEDSPTGGDVTVSGSAIPEGTTLTVAEYTSNPGGTPTFAATGDYYDVHLSDDEGVESLTIEFCPAEEDTVIYYWDGTSWRRATSQIYVGGCIVVYITDSTFPSLSDLTGRYFASGTPYPPAPVGGKAYPVNKLAILAPWIVLFAAIIAATETMLRRRRAQS